MCQVLRVLTHLQCFLQCIDDLQKPLIYFIRHNRQHGLAIARDCTDMLFAGYKLLRQMVDSLSVPRT